MTNDIKIEWDKIQDIIDKYDSNPENLLMIMQDITHLYNYVPPEVLPLLKEKLNVDESLIFSVATFYKTISLEPRGKHIINVCTGTACHILGAQKIMDAYKEKLNIGEGQTTEDGMFSLEGVRCIGCCASGPVITVDNEIHGGLDQSKALEVIGTYEKPSEKCAVKEEG
ncbi:MAG: NAD(P)H-dependent oxidoreductase subunit E [Desulfobacula sp.]|nr:NAD(P)H-dependent oxidoreductase subunit E [Desulfobacula sp.]